MLVKFVGVAALVAVVGVQASEISLYLSQPGKTAQSTYVAAGMEPEIANATFKIERFDGRAADALTKEPAGTWSVGAYEVLGSGASIKPADIYGGAGGKGQYLSPGNGVSVTLDKPARYFGFWWSAGDASNKVELYDVTDTKVATLTTADLVSFLQKNAALMAIDGVTQYDRARYYDNPVKGGNGAEPYAYLNFVLSDDAPTASSFKRIVFSGSKFELDNIGVRDLTLPEKEFPPTWVETNPTYPVKDSLLAQDDAFVTGEGSPVSIQGLIGNDTLPSKGGIPIHDFDPVKLVGKTPHGEIKLVNGELVFTPQPGFSGAESIPYTVCLKDYPEACTTATITILVTTTVPVGGTTTAPPVVLPPTVPGHTVKPDSSAGGTFEPDTGRYVPPANFVGEDTITYTICEVANPAQCTTSTTTVHIAPQPGTDSRTTDMNTRTDGQVPQPGSPNAPGLPAGHDYTYGEPTLNSVHGGKVTMGANGSYTYVPPAGFVGDDTFTYQVCLADMPTVCGVNTVVVTVNPPARDHLVAVPPAQSGVAGGLWDPVQDGAAPPGLEWGVMDPQDPSAGAIPSGPTANSGTVTADPSTGTFQYTPPPGFTGFDEFEYQVCLVDGADRWCNTGKVQIVVPQTAPVPPAGNTVTGALPQPDPTAPTLAYRVPGATPGSGGMTSGQTPHGSVIVTPNGEYTYTLAPGFSGEDVVTLESCTIGTPPQCVTVEVPVRVPPAVPDLSSTYRPGVPSGGTLTVTGLPNSTPRFEVVGSPAKGNVVVHPDGSYTYTPESGDTSTVTFTYRACLPLANGDELCSDPATVTLTSNAVVGNASPVPVPAIGVGGLLGLSGLLGLWMARQARRRRH